MSIAEIILAVFTTAATAITAWAAVHKANQLAMFRIEQLEKKVELHNGLDRRIVALEAAMKFREDSR